MVKRAAALLVAVLLLPASGAPPSAPARRSLVLVTLDTTRADHLGAWGWSWARTPNLDALAAQGTRFARCDTAVVITLPSHATILTGLYPPRHGVRDNGLFTLQDKVGTVAESLRGAGYDTAAVVSAIVLARRYGLNRGFRIYDDDLGAGYSAGTEVEERTADATTDKAISILAGLRPPFFLWVHYFDPHEEYKPPSRYVDPQKGPNRLYDGEIAYMDAGLGRLLAALPKETTVLAVGDHGEMLGEHGEDSHGLLLFEGARRVPLLLAGPGIPKGKTVPGLVRTVDVTPTLLELAGLPLPAGPDGQSLLPLLSGRGEPRTSYTESFLPFFSYRWYPLRSVSDGPWLYLRAPHPDLFSLDGPHPEQTDLSAKEPAHVARLGAMLEKLLAPSEPVEGRLWKEMALDDEQAKQLASLGYLGAGAAAGRVSRDLPDPRKMTDVARALRRATDSVKSGAFGEALTQLETILRKDPSNFPALTIAGTCLIETGDPTRALQAFQRAEAINPLSAVPFANGGTCLLKLGRRNEAEEAYRHALRLDPAIRRAAPALARLLREKGAGKEARRTLDEAIAAGGRFPETYLERGVLKAESGDLAGALEDFLEAGRRDPTDRLALENAARAAYRLGRHREAALLYERLVASAPDRGDAWKTLGAIRLYELHDRAGAATAFRSALRVEHDPAERAKLEDLIREQGE